MKIAKAKLEKLQGLCPCSSVLSFVPSVYDDIKKDKGMKDYIPEFTCNALTDGQADEVKKHSQKRYDSISKNEAFPKKKEGMLEVIGSNIIGWKNLYNITTGEELEYSPEVVKQLPENVIESIMMELSYYAGIVPRRL